MDYYDDGSTGATELGAAYLIFGLVYAVIGLGTYIWWGIAGSALLKKAGYPNPWAAWVPIYNTYSLLEVGKQKGWWVFILFGAALLNIIPFLGSLIYLAAAVFVAIAMVYAFININKAFGKDTTTWTIFAFLVPLIWMTVLAFGANNRWNGALANGPYFMNKDAQLQNAGYNGYQQQQQWQQPQAPQQWQGQGTPEKPVYDQNPYGQQPPAPQSPYGQPTPPSPYGQQPPAPQAPTNPYGGPAQPPAPQNPYGQGPTPPSPYGN